MSGLLTPAHWPRSRTSAVLEELARQPESRPYRIGDIVARLGDRTYGLLLIILSALNVLPFIALLLGPAISGLGLQMVLGIRQPWLPQALLNIELPRQRTAQLLQELATRIRKQEKNVRPRWLFMEAPIIDRGHGLLVMALGMIIAIPAPLTNIPPSITLLLLGLGLTERDGLLQLIGFITGLAALLLFGSLAITVLLALL